MHTRRNFLKTAAMAAPAWRWPSGMTGFALAQGGPATTERFLFGHPCIPKSTARDRVK